LGPSFLYLCLPLIWVLSFIDAWQVFINSVLMRMHLNM
jgi:hypothetical protein